MRSPLIAGNWKMNTRVSEAIGLVRDMLTELDNINGVEKVLCPPFVSLLPLKDLVKGSSIRLGAQNMYFEERGAFTGEISPIMLADLCQYVILGHSERRNYFSETDEMINSKVKAAFRHGLTPILCVGENLVEKEAGITQEVVKRQIGMALKGVSPSGSLVVAYEPVWAIGTGKAATGGQAAATIEFIRDTIGTVWDKKMAQEVRILYGGSVTSANISQFIAEPTIDGALVGGASIKTSEFLSIVGQTAVVKSKFKM